MKSITAGLLFALVTIHSGFSESPHSNVLLLASYHPGHIWTDGEIAAEQSYFRDSVPSASVFVEYMDWKRFPNQSNIQEFWHRLSLKYKGVVFDAVLANDNAALMFSVAQRESFLAGVPIVFAGINGYEDLVATLPANITGVAETIDPKATIQTALAIHPDTRRIVVITDRTQSGLGTKSEVQRAIRTLSITDTEFEFIDHIGMDDLLGFLKTLSSGDLVYMTYFNRDSAGTFYTHEESIELIVDACPVPVYHAYDFALGHGVVGGHLLNAQAMGRAAARMTHQVLLGIPADEIPIMTNSPCPPMFDAAVMSRYGIPLEALPPDALVINKPEGIWHRYGRLLAGILAFIAVQSLVIGALAVNIMRAKRAEDALRRSEARFRTLIEGSPVAALVARKGTILYVNSAFLDLSGYASADDVLGHTVLDFTVKGRHKEVATYIALREKGEDAPHSYTIEGIDADGNHIPLQLFASSVSMDDGPATLVFLTDLRPLKKAEDEKIRILKHFEQAQKMESLSLLAGGIAHDFNNLLTGISTNASLAQIVPENERDEYFSSLQTAVRRASQLSRQLLTFSRGGEPVKSLVILNDIIHDSVSFVLRGSHHTAQVEIDSDLWPIEADSGQISQVMNNLLINAKQAMHQPGELRVTARNVELESMNVPQLAAGTYVQLEIRDQGEGISEENLSRIFDPFFTTKEHGSGLGLASVYSIIQAHSGHVSVESLVGEGTTFSILLPASESLLEQDGTISDSFSSQAKRILVMDDDEIVRTSIEKMLRALGHQVVAVPDGASAVEEFEHALKGRQHFELAILDLTIPGGMGGKDTIAELRKRDNSIRAIAASGYCTDDVLANCTAYGFSASLSKPFSIEELSQAINKACSPSA